MINPQADPRRTRFPVKVRVENRIENDQPLLKAGMFARVTLAVGKPTPCVLVPKDAVVLGGPSPMVFWSPLPPAERPSSARCQSRSVPRKAPGSPRSATSKKATQVIVEGNERVRPGQEHANRAERSGLSVKIK